jgi:hypothetical protein
MSLISAGSISLDSTFKGDQAWEFYLAFILSLFLWIRSCLAKVFLKLDESKNCYWLHLGPNKGFKWFFIIFTLFNDLKCQFYKACWLCAKFFCTHASRYYFIAHAKTKSATSAKVGLTLLFLSLPASHLCHQGLGWPCIIVGSFIY